MAVLVRGSGWLVWLAFFVPLSFLAIGGGGLTYTIFTWGKSAERCAALVQKTSRLAPFRNVASTAEEFPNIPVSTNITDSPGTVLAFRLPVSGATAWGLVLTLLACIFWNGVVSIFAGIAINGHRSGNPDWRLTLFVVPFALVGVGLILFFLRKFLATTRIGPTLVEISDQPLYPGRRYRVFLQQSGRLKINRLEVLLVCEEEATFRHGTDTRMETRLVAQQSLMLCENAEVRPGVPLETDCELEVPRDAMHSFKSQHNEVAWKVQVRLDVAGWPAHERSFPVIVYPPQVPVAPERLVVPASRVVEQRPGVRDDAATAAVAAAINAGVGATASGL